MKDTLYARVGRSRLSLYPASVSTVNGVKWGYINASGQFLITPQFEYANPFQENGLAVVSENSKAALIDRQGNFIVPPRYDFINPFSEGLAIVGDANGYAVIDESGKELTAQRYGYIDSYHEGRAVFNEEVTGKYGYLDRTGAAVLPPQYESAGYFNNGVATVKLMDYKYALINPDGQILRQYPYAFVGDLSEGLLAYQQVTNGKFGYINVDGQVVIPPSYASAQGFQDGRAIVNIYDVYENKYGLIDPKGNFIIKPEYGDIEIIARDRAAVGVPIDKDRPYFGYKYALFDLDGKRLTDFEFTRIGEFEGGVASAADNRNTFFISKDGKKVRSLPTVRGIGTLSITGDIIAANVNLRVFYLDLKGNVIWKQNSIIPLTGEIKVKEIEYNPNPNYLVYYPQLLGLRDKKVENSINARLKELSNIKPVPPNKQLENSYTGDFNVFFYNKDLLVLRLSAYDYPFGAAHGMPSEIYPNIDLQTGKFYELGDLFQRGSNYVKVLSDIIQQEIENNPEYSYIFPDEYTGIKADQPFYVDQNNLFIYFTPYEIAPYAAGFPTFRIPFVQIMDIINQQGEFWRSFN